jgi:hypothetical protein
MVKKINLKVEKDTIHRAAKEERHRFVKAKRTARTKEKVVVG